MKKIFIILLLIAVPLLSSEETKKFSITRYITGENLRARSKPSARSEIMGYFKKGTRVLCWNRTSQKQRIGKWNDYWYWCVTHHTSAYDVWVYGAFLSEKFDRKKYIESVKKPLGTKEMAVYQSRYLHNKPSMSYSFCKKNSHRNCKDNYIFTGNTIAQNVMGYREEFLITKMTQKDASLVLETELLFCERLEKRKERKLTLYLKHNPDGSVNLNGNSLYRW